MIKDQGPLKTLCIMAFGAEVQNYLVSGPFGVRSQSGRCFPLPGKQSRDGSSCSGDLPRSFEPLGHPGAKLKVYWAVSGN